jgi:outer membrane receptor protein involved in Fe transport
MTSSVSKKSKLITLLVLFLSSFLSNGQTGTITGIVTDSVAGETIIGAIITVKENAAMGAQTDWEGKFVIPNVKPGTYTIRVNYVGYTTREIYPVVVVASTTNNLGVIYLDLDEEVPSIVIRADRVTNTTEAVVQEIKDQEQVVSGTSAQDIAKTTDRDAAAVVSRISGVTIIDNSFILVRGLNRRYNGIMLNGVMAPSTEIDSRAFALDLIPSNMIDRMLVFKSASDELPGDMTGSMVKLYTRSTVAQRFTQVNLGFGFRPGTTFTTRQSQTTSSTDWLGFDSKRAFPSAFPDNLNAPNIIFDPIAQENAAKSLNNDWTLNDRFLLPDLRLGLNMGRFFYVGKTKISNITSVNYSNTNQYYNAARSRNLYNGTEPSELFNYDYATLQKSSRVGILCNWQASINERNKIEFRNMFNQSGQNETLERTGLNKKTGSNPVSWFDIKDRSLYYQERGIYSGQLTGEHKLKNKTTMLDWASGLSHIYRNEPDFRRGGYQRVNDGMSDYRVVIPPQASDNNAARFMSSLKETTVAGALNLTHALKGTNDSTSTKGIKIRGGLYIERRSRSFESRWLSYIRASSGFDPAKDLLPLETIFADENISYQNGFILNEGTDGTNKYTASNMLFAGYGGTSFSFLKKFNANAGVRVEHNTQKIDTKNQSGQNISVNNPILNVLPSLGLIYNLTEKTLFRATWAQTINRPEFRELAPFGFYDFENSWKVNGNPNLVNATANNYDVRAEFYPNAKEAISVGVFYKDINNPIEFYIQPVGAFDQNFEYRNASKAVCYGTELELRKSLGFIASNKFFDNMILLTNLSYIYSEVKLGDVQGGQSNKRSLQGQSPYIINAGLSYNDSDKGLVVNATYNVFGNRIFGIGDAQFATLYERSRHTVDFTLTKKMKENMEFKIGINDILNAPVRYTEDSNKNFKMDSSDQLVTSYRRGTYFTIGWSYKL